MGLCFQVRSIDLRSPFNDLDVNRDGTISKREFEEALQRIGLRVEEEELHV
jgi:Ca2+-binding EF-hand superfamily protein